MTNTTNTIEKATNVTMQKNEEHNGIELSFNGKPDADIIKNLKDGGWHWHNVRKVWYVKASSDAEKLANNLIAYYEKNIKDAPKSEKKAKAVAKSEKAEVKAETKSNDDAIIKAINELNSKIAEHEKDIAELKKLVEMLSVASKKKATK